MSQWKWCQNGKAKKEGYSYYQCPWEKYKAMEQNNIQMKKKENFPK